MYYAHFILSSVFATCVLIFLHDFPSFRMDHFIDLTDVHHEEEVVLAVPVDDPDPDPCPCPLSGGLAANPDVVDALAHAPNLAGVAARCFLASRAPGTVGRYNSAV